MISSSPMSKWAHIDLEGSVKNNIYMRSGKSWENCTKSQQYEKRQMCLLVSDFLLRYWGWQSWVTRLPSFPCWILIPSPHFGHQPKQEPENGHKYNFLHPNCNLFIKNATSPTWARKWHKTIPCTPYNCQCPNFPLTILRKKLTFKPRARKVPQHNALQSKHFSSTHQLIQRP